MKTKELFAEMREEMATLAFQYDNGDIELLEAVTELEKLRKPLEENLKFIKDFKDENINEIENEAMNYKDGYNGYLIEVRNGGAIYSYKNIEEWQTYDKAKKECEMRHKQAYLSNLKGLTSTDENGEVIELPEIKYRKNSVIIKTIK